MIPGSRLAVAVVVTQIGERTCRMSLAVIALNGFTPMTGLAWVLIVPAHGRGPWHSAGRAHRHGCRVRRRR